MKFSISIWKISEQSSQLCWENRLAKPSKHGTRLIAAYDWTLAI